MKEIIIQIYVPVSDEFFLLILDLSGTSALYFVQACLKEVRDQPWKYLEAHTKVQNWDL